VVLIRLAGSPIPGARGAPSSRFNPLTTQAPEAAVLAGQPPPADAFDDDIPAASNTSSTGS
jgi:hypothetical protein